MEFSIPLNKFEKQQKVIELHKQGKTYKEISIQAHKNFRDIKKIITTYERKKELQAKREENNQNGQIKKPLIGTQAYKLFSDGKKLTDVAIDLEIPAKRALRLWSQFLRLERMYECYEFYQVFQSQIPDILAISSFIRENNVDTRNISRILKEATDVYHLQSYRSEIKNELERLKQNKNNQQYSQNNFYYPLKPLTKMNWNYPYRNNYW